MDVQRRPSAERRAHLVPLLHHCHAAPGTMVGGEPVGEMWIAVDRQQGAVGIAGDQDGARTHEIGERSAARTRAPRRRTALRR